VHPRWGKTSTASRVVVNPLTAKVVALPTCGTDLEKKAVVAMLRELHPRVLREAEPSDWVTAGVTVLTPTATVQASRTTAASYPPSVKRAQKNHHTTTISKYWTLGATPAAASLLAKGFLPLLLVLLRKGPLVGPCQANPSS